MGSKRKATTNSNIIAAKRVQRDVSGAAAQQALTDDSDGVSDTPDIVDLTSGASTADVVDPTGETSSESEDDAVVSPFRFLDLPAEIRLSIYRYVLPHGFYVSFRPTLSREGECEDTEIHVTKEFDRNSDLSQLTSSPPVNPQPFPGLSTSIFLANKFIFNEAKAVLYGENVFAFTIDDKSHYPKSLKSLEIFRPFETEGQLPVLRNLRTIIIVVKFNDNSPDHWVHTRHRARLDYFISILKQHADDDNQKSLLKDLRVYYDLSPYAMLAHTKNMYSLEALTQLRGIEQVQVTGSRLPTWFSQCLQLAIQGKGGDVLPIDYPEVEVKQAMPKGVMGAKRRFKKVMQTTKLWHEPSLNWEEFAARNGIQIPTHDVVDLTQGERGALSKRAVPRRR